MFHFFAVQITPPTITALHRLDLIGPKRHPGLRTHNVHEHPNALVGCDLLDFGCEVSKGPAGQHYLIARLQKFWWQKLARGVARAH